MSVEIQTDRAHDFCEQAFALRRQMDTCGFDFGAVLLVIRRDRLFEVKGCETFTEFLQLPELGVSPAHAYKLMAWAEAYLPLSHGATPVVSREEISAMGIRKALAIAPLVQDAPLERQRELIAQAATLAEPDLRREVRRANGQDTERAAYLDGLGRKLVALGIKVRDDNDAEEALQEAVAVAVAGAERLEREYGA